MFLFFTQNLCESHKRSRHTSRFKSWTHLVICYQLPKSTFVELIKKKSTFLVKFEFTELCVRC